VVPRATWLAAGAAVSAAVAYAAGPMAVSLVAGLLAVSAGLASSRSRRGVPFTAAGIGAVLIALRVLLGPPAPEVPPLPSSPGPWTAIVESVGSPLDGKQVARLALEVEPGPVHVAATLPSFPSVRAGDSVAVGGRLRAPPEDDGYGEYLRRTGAAGSLDARSLAVIAPASGLSLQPARDAAGDALRVSLPEPEAGLAAGILVGLRERVDRALAADFATAGVSHVVAISGWNIAIVAGLVGALMRGRSRRLVTVVVGSTIGAYVLAAGASPSVVRAAVMAAVVLLARESGRSARAPAALALAAFAMLAVDPAMIGDAGFRLSVAATAGLLAWGTPLGRWIAGLGSGRVPAWLAEGLGISLAAQAATLPDVLVTFGRLSLVAPVVNLAVVPLVPAAMGAGVVAMGGGALAMAGLPAGVATLLGLPAWLLLHLIVAFVRLGAGVPFAAVPIPPEAAPVAALMAAGLVLVAPAMLRRLRAAPAQHRRRPRPDRRPSAPRTRSAVIGTGRLAVPGSRGGRLALGVVAVAVVLSTLAMTDVAGRSTRLVMLDVGQGDAILVESRGGARMLVDGGPDPDRLLVALDEQVPPWDRRIDILVLSHPHEDHVAGLVRALERYRVGRVFEPGMHGPGPGWAAWDAALQRGPPRATLSTGARLRLDEISLAVLWPDPGVPAEPASTGRGINDTSIILLGEANARRFLLTGDAEDDVDPSLLARNLPTIDVLKVAHHGSATATSAPLLAALQPALALVSVGADNDYGHPAPSTLGRLRDVGARILRTDLDGTVEVDLRADGLRVRTAGRRRTSGVTTPELAARPAITGYDSGHDDPDPARGRPPAAVPGPARVVRQARLRRRGHRRLARPGDPSQRDVVRRACGRGGGAAPRRGQDPGRARGRHAPRRWVRRVARRARHAGAGVAGPRSPGESIRG
jgi:competence protein ComEC